MTYIVATDTGGTFTDLAAFNVDDGTLTYGKSLTTYGDLVDGVMNCVERANVDLVNTDVLKHGTTLVINTFINRSGARTALVTTRGFRDVLEVRRGNRPRPFDLRYRRDPELIPRDLRFEIPERVDAQGEELIPLDREKLGELARELKTLNVEAVAVSFVNSYLNSAHEEEAIRILRDALPNVYVTSGTELSREWYEYERTSTAAANAYVGPNLRSYIDRFVKRLKDGGFRRTFYMMGSNGGVLATDRAVKQPVVLVESGPVGGCIGAAALATHLGIGNAVAFDMGGTTAKCALIEKGGLDIQSPYFVGGYEQGFPIRGSVLDIIEVGAGGGSIAWLDEQERLRVGPQSAGSDPGPVAYGRNGSEPTVTDANLVLGRIGSDAFLSGELSLDIDRARDAIASKVAAPLGLTAAAGVDQAAQGVIAMAALTMANAIKQISVERGRDPREFALIAFGGGGPLHAAELARELHIPTVVVPPEPGNFSAIGMLLADARIDDSQSFLRPLEPHTMAAMDALFGEMEATLSEALREEIGAEMIAFERQAEMRYRGQKHSMRTPLGGLKDAMEIRRAFENHYLEKFGHVDQSAPIEFISLGVTATASTHRPDITRLQRPATTGEVHDEEKSRSVFFSELGRRVETCVYNRAGLHVGFKGSGPAIVEEYGSTTVIGPRDTFEVGSLGEIWISCATEATRQS